MSTTVQSKNVNNNAPACSQIIPTNEGHIEIPPKAHEFGISIKELKQGEMLEIPAYKGNVKENGEMNLADGKTLKISKEALMNLTSNIKERKQMQAKLSKELESAR